MISPKIDAAVTLVAGLWACRVGWCHPALRDQAGAPQPDDADAPPLVPAERLIGPLIIALAVIEFVASPG